MKAATAGIFVVATLGSTVMLKGSSPPEHHPAPAASVEHVRSH